MKEIIDREDRESMKILVKGKYINDRDKFLREKFNGIINGGSIRISKDEYKYIDRKKEFLVHFNLQVSHHEVGENYVLPKILKHGFFTKKKNNYQIYLMIMLFWENVF